MCVCIYMCIFLFNRSVVSDSLQPYGLQHARLPCPSPSPRACSNSCPLSQSCHPTISSSVVLFSFCLSLSQCRSFPVDRLSASGGQNIRASASASLVLANLATHRKGCGQLQVQSSLPIVFHTKWCNSYVFRIQLWVALSAATLNSVSFPFFWVIA